MTSIENRATRTFEDACILRATVATTGYQGGDAGHGGQTKIVLDDLGNTDIEASFVEEVIPTPGGDVLRRLAINLGGDAELRVIIKALRFSADALEALAKGSENEPIF